MIHVDVVEKCKSYNIGYIQNQSSTDACLQLIVVKFVTAFFHKHDIHIAPLCTYN